MESLFVMVQQWISSGSIWLAAGGSFVGGALTAMNPCVSGDGPTADRLHWWYGRKNRYVEILSLHVGLYHRFQHGIGHPLYRRTGGRAVSSITGT